MQRANTFIIKSLSAIIHRTAIKKSRNVPISDASSSFNGDTQSTRAIPGIRSSITFIPHSEPAPSQVPISSVSNTVLTDNLAAPSSCSQDTNVPPTAVIDTGTLPKRRKGKNQVQGPENKDELKLNLVQPKHELSN